MTEKNNEINTDVKPEDFVRLLTENFARIYTYIYGLIGSHHDAEDVMQETSNVLWRKFSDYQTGTNFLAWALTIAYFQVLDFRKRMKYRRVRQFDQEVLEKLNQDAQAKSENVDAYIHWLKHCIKKLKEEDRYLITLRFVDGQTVKMIAENISQSVQNIHYHLRKIYDSLRQCVHVSMKSEGKG